MATTATQRLKILITALAAILAVGASYGVWLASRPPAFMVIGTCVALSGTESSVSWTQADCNAAGTVAYTVTSVSEKTTACVSPSYHVYTDTLGRTACLMPNLVKDRCYASAHQVLSPVDCASAPAATSIKVTAIHDVADPAKCAAKTQKPLVYGANTRTICFSRVD